MATQQARIQLFSAVAEASGSVSESALIPEHVHRRGGSENQPAPCASCFGTGMEVVPGRGARRCHCRQENEQSRRLGQARIPRRYDNCTFSNYRPAPGNATQFQAFRRAYGLATDYCASDRGLLLMGTCGVGKTHLAVAVLHRLMEQGINCLFYECGALLKEVQESFEPTSQNSELKILAPVADAEVLVLDELGAPKPTEWVRDTLMQIIGARYNNRKLTIFTTNYMDTRRSPAEETLEERIGVRLRSRLYEMCRTVVIDGDDYRRRMDGG